MVQPELHSPDEGRQVDGNPGEPHADAPAAGVPEVVEPDLLATPKLADEADERRREAFALQPEPDDHPAKDFAVQTEPSELDIPLKDDYVSSEYRSHDDWGPQVIPEGYYFVMGDHRNNSSDSRHWGMVPKKYIIGKVQIRWWPVPTARVF